MKGDTLEEFPVVGIGASAGGLEALRDLVSAVPRDSGMAYVIVQHLSPDHPSIMDQLLGAHAEIPVVKIEDGMTLAPDKVFVIPAGPSLTLDGRILRLHERENDAVLRTPIDLFFTSLADNFGTNAFCVVLSGTGSDGTLGLRSVKAAGGFAAAQSHDSARFPSMPDSAAATGLVDFHLRPGDIPGRLIEVARHRMKILGHDDRENQAAEIKERLPEIVELIGGEDGHDFSEYKAGTLVRRIERRMTVLRLQSVDGLIGKLQDNPDERQQLLQDFLIGVTQFFRNEDAFESLRKEIVCPLLDRDQQKFRIWVPGCSTGEEALSIAMLFHEEAERRGDSRDFQVFGTDIDTAALTRARAGVFPKGALSGLSEAYRERYFTPIDDTFQVNGLLRERCVFAPHNLVQDPPFSRLDLISCRNLMIYLTPGIQEEIIHRFHYGLNEGGYLFLGPSESLGRAERMFTVADREARIFKRNDRQSAHYSALSARVAPTRTGPSLPSASYATTGHRERLEPTFEQEVLQFFLRETAAPIAVINADDEVVYVSEQMGSFVRPASGVVSPSLDQFLSRDLRLPLRSAIDEARQEGRPAAVRNVVVESEGTRRLVDVDARPLPVREGCIFVTVQPVRAQDGEELAKDADEQARWDRDLAEREMVLTKRQLESTRTQFEVTETELRTSNEELLSMNEELQSSNEELETSREELQSINEELETVNAELGENNRLLATANSDLKNLFESTDVATLFLDQNLCVRRYTPATRKLFGIQERDVGRSIKDLAWRVSYDKLEEDAKEVGRTLQPIEREVRIEATDETFLMQIRAYRTVENRIDGSVVTFFDITGRKRQEQQLAANAETLARQYAELESLYDTTPVGLNLLDENLRYLRINQRLAEINGFPPEAHIGKRQEDLLPEIDEQVREAQLTVLRTGEPITGIEVHGTTPAEPGVERDWIVDYYPVKRDGKVFAVGSCVTEVTEEKRLQKEVQESEAQLRRMLDNMVAFAAVMEPDGTLEQINRPVIERGGVPAEDVIGQKFWDGYWWGMDEAVRARVRDAVQSAGRGETVRFESKCRIMPGDLIDVDVLIAPLYGRSGQLLEIIASAFEVTERVEAEQRQSLLLEELQHRVKNSMAITSAVVQFSARRETSVANFARTLSARLQAIARTHDLLTTNDWKGSSLRDIVEAELAPYAQGDEGRTLFEGDNVTLNAKHSLALALAFHELATNAAKYGALSGDTGTVRVVSDQSEEGPVTVTWTERGGPEVVPPARDGTGFGSFLLEKVLGGDIRGSTEVTYDPEGLQCVIRFAPENDSLQAAAAEAT